MSKIIKFEVRPSDGNFYVPDSSGRMLCGTVLREYFDIPDDARVIYVTLSDKRLLQSYQVRLPEWCPFSLNERQNVEFLDIRRDRHNNEYLVGGLRSYIRKLGLSNKVVYVKVQYE